MVCSVVFRTVLVFHILHTYSVFLPIELFLASRPPVPSVEPLVPGKNNTNINIKDHLFGIVVSMSDCHPRGPGFDSRLYPRNFSISIGSGTGSTQPREDNWVAT